MRFTKISIYRQNICLFICLVFIVWMINDLEAMNVGQLKCEYRINPLGIDTKEPRLSWVLTSEKRAEFQTAYQIVVASDTSKLSESEADIWNSEKVTSSQSVHVNYSGKELQARQRYFWKVRTWDKDGHPSDWSEMASWEMALLEKYDWQANWINDGKPQPGRDEDFYKEDPAPLFRKEFVLSNEIKKARLYITGLGYYEAFINGKRIGENVLDPGWTNYLKRVYYSVYDMTDKLESGNNCLGVSLGNGWYNPLPLRMWGHLNLREHLPTGRPRFIAQLEITYRDNSKTIISSDKSWRYSTGPILRNNIYLGEVYDARREIQNWSDVGLDDNKWQPVNTVLDTMGSLQVQPLQPIRITKVIKARKITQPVPGVYIVDMGQNFAGWATFKFKVPRDTKIRMRYGELLYEDGTLNPMTSVCGQIKGKRKDENGLEINKGGPGSPEFAWQADTYIAKGENWEEYRPRFTFHAFRYIEITGYPGEITADMITGLRLNSNVQETGTFSCSNQMFNDIQKMTQWTFLSNIFSVQSDCPHREKFGYGGDLVGTNEALMYNYDMESFYVKAVQDWQDAADEKGMFTDTAPFVGIQYCGIAWAMIHPLLQLNLYKYYGNRRIMEEQYEVAQSWMELVISQYPDYIVTDGLSDHESIHDTPPEQLVTPLYFYSAEMMAEIATILGRSKDRKRYEQLSENIKKTYLERFFDKQSGRVDPGTQTSQSFALYLNLLPTDQKDAALDYLQKNIVKDNNGHLTTGILGTPFMLDVLCRNNRENIAYDIVNKKTYPGWGFMLENDATSLWEHWEFSDNVYSHNHPMFGSVSQWFFNWLGGIQPAPDAVGFNKIIFQPKFIEDLNWVESSLQSVRGKIASNWYRENDKIRFEINVPVNTEAELRLNLEEHDRILENGLPIKEAVGIRMVSEKKYLKIYRLGSGIFNFEINRKNYE